MKNRQQNYILLITSVSALILTFFVPPCGANVLCLVFGFTGIWYCSALLKTMFTDPIRRDLILVKGDFLVRIINSVILTPFVIALIIMLLGGPDYSTMNLIYDENLFPSEQSSAPGPEISSHSAAAIEQPPHRHPGPKTDPNIFWGVYFHFVDAGNQFMADSDSGRRLAALISVLGILLLNGLLVSVLINWFDRRRENWYSGAVRYATGAFRNRSFAIIIGADKTVPLIIKRLLAGEGESEELDYVILLTNTDTQAVRNGIDSNLTDEESDRVVIYNGQLDSEEEIARLWPALATEIYILGEASPTHESLSYHDTQNMKCVRILAHSLSDSTPGCYRKKCRVLFEYQTTFSVFQFSDLSDHTKKHLDFIPMNNYENWSQCVMVRGKFEDPLSKGIAPIKYTPLDGDGIGPDSGNHVHFVVVGMSKMGVAMAIQAAQILHFPNFRPEDRNPIRSRITFIDLHADQEKNYFMGRFEYLFGMTRHRFVDANLTGSIDAEPWTDPIKDSTEYSHFENNFIDFEWEFIKGSVEQDSVRKYLELSARAANPSGKTQGRAQLTIAICLPLANQAIAAAIYMPDTVYRYAQEIWVYQNESSDIVYNLYYSENEGDKTKHKRYSKLRPFGMRYADFSMDKLSSTSSALCSYAYTLMGGDKKSMRTAFSNLDNMEDIMSNWEKERIADKWSNKYLSNSFGTKLRSAGVAYESDYEVQIEALEKYGEEIAAAEHNRWVVQQLLIGFRPLNDEESRTYKELMKKRDSAQTEEQKTRYKNEMAAYKSQKKASEEKAHLDICSCKELEEVDPGVKPYDDKYIYVIPDIIKITEKIQKS